MAPRSLLLLLALAIGPAVSAQLLGQPTIQVYPVRVNHKIGYVKIYDTPAAAYIDTVIPPRYGYIGDENLPWNGEEDGAASPYRLFEIDEKVGLLGPSLEEVLPGRYNRIRAVAPGWFAVEEDSLFALVDAAGHPLFGNERYDDIRLADAFPEQGRAYFFVKKNQAWGLRSSAGAAPAAFPFAEAHRTESKGYFKVKTGPGDGGWQVVDTTGRWVVKTAFEDVKVLNNRFFIAKGEQHWHLLRKKSPDEYDLGMEKYTQAEKINDSLAILVPLPSDNQPEELQLWRTSPEPLRILSQKIARRPVKAVAEARQFELARLTAYAVPWYFPLDDRYIICNKAAAASSNIDVLMDYAGREVSDNYEFILPSGRPQVYRASRRGQWGLLLPEAEPQLLVRCAYDTIYGFQGDLAVCRRGHKYGVLGIVDARAYELPCLYESISLLDCGRVRAQMEGFVVTLAFRPGEGFVEEQVLARSILVSENTAFAIQEAAPVAKTAAPRYQPKLLEAPPPKLWRGFQGEIFVAKIQEAKTDDGRVYQDTAWLQQLPLPAMPRRLEELDADRLLAIHDRDSPVSTPFLLSFFGQPAAAVRFYDLRQQKFVDREKVIGYRSFDYCYAYTAFMDADGQMGLMDHHGKALAKDGKPLRYTYIGPFMAGRARVCIGGQLVVDAKGKLEAPVKFKLASAADFLREFGILSPGGREAAGSKGDAGIYVVSTPERPARWGYLDAGGKLVISTDADHVLDFHWQDSTALFLRKNQRTHWGRPDADYGILDFRGREIAPAQYSEVSNMEGYYLVSVDSTPTFYFTQKGVELFVNPTRLRPFAEGLAQFFDAESGQWGYLDTAGRVAIPPRFAQARPFSEGLALVADDSARCVFIDTAGQVVFATDIPARGHQFIGDFRGGRCWFKASGKSWAWGAYRPDGQVAIIPQCYYRPEVLAPLPPDVPNPLPMDFSRGAAAVAFLSAAGTPQYALIDTLGKLLYPRHRLRHIGRLDELGLAVCTDFQGRKGLLDYRGEVLVKPAYAEIEGFVNGFAKAKGLDGRWGLLSQHGREALPANYIDIGSAAEGLVAVKAFGREGWSFVDTSNQLRLRGPFDEAGAFNDGLAFLKQGGKPVIINREGKQLSVRKGQPLFFSEGVFGIEDPERGPYYADAAGNNLFGRYFQEITPFQLGVAAVRRQPLSRSRAELLGAINRRGVMVVPPKFRLLHIQPDGNIITNPQRFYGLLDKRGRLLIPPAFDRIEQFDEGGLFRVERGEAVGYMRIAKERGEWVWGLQK